MADDDAPSLPPAAATKVLQADLRNSVAAVAAGQRLPEADRARFETSVLTGADEETVAGLAKERLANLLKIWASGRRRLNPAELKELEPLLPREALTRQPIKQAGYKQVYATYATTYGVAERTIKEWVNVGRSISPDPDMPPLDEPAKMKEWYARCKKNRVPDRLIELASATARLASAETVEPCKHVFTTPVEASTPAATSAPASAASLPGPATPAKPAAAGVAQGYTATLERLRAAEAAAGERYTRLILEPGKESEAEQARRSWESLTKQLRAYEKDAEEIMQKNGQSWFSADVIAAMHDVHVPLRDGMLSLYARIENQLEPLTPAARRRLYRDEVLRLFASLVANRFTAPPAEQAAA